MLETWSLKQLTAAVEKALRFRIHTADAIEQFLPAHRPWEQTTFKLADLDSNGFNAPLVGAWGYNSDQGRVYLYYGGPDN